MKHKDPDLRARALGWIGRMSTRHWKWVLIVVLLSLVACGFAISTLQITTRYVDLLPQEHASVKNYFKALDKFGGTDYFMVMIEGKGPEQTRALADELAGRLDKTDRFRYIQYRADLEQFEKYGLLFLDKEVLNKLDVLLAERNIPELTRLAESFMSMRGDLSQTFGGGIRLDDKGYFTSEDGKSALLIARPDFSADDLKEVTPFGRDMEEMMAGVEQENPGVKISLSGNYTFQYEQKTVVNRDVMLVGIIALAVILVVLAIGFKSLTLPFVAVLSLGVGVVWTLAFTRLTVKSLNTVSSVFAAVLMGIGIEYSIALVARYREEHRRGRDRETAFAIALGNTGKGIITGALTTAGAFYAIAFSEFKAMRDMGLVLGTGVLCVLLSTFVVLPALMTLKEKIFRKSAASGAGEDMESGPMRKEGDFVARRPWWIIGVAMALTVGLGVSALFIKYESNIKKVQPRGMKVTDAEEKLQEKYGIGTDFVIVLSNNEAAMREDTEKLEKLSSVRAVESIATIIPADQLGKLVLMSRIASKVESINPEWLKYVPAQMLDILRDIGSDTLTIDKLPPDTLEKYISKDGTYATYVYPKKSMAEEKNVEEFLDQVHSVSTDAIGFPVIVQDILESTRKGLNDTTLLSAVVVLLMVVIDFQRLLPTVLAMFPLGFAMIWMMGAFNLFGMKFNIVNVAVTPMILGIGVDFGVYVLHRYEEEHEGGGEAIPSTLAHTGKAILISGITVLAAFAALMLARYQGLASLGLAAVLGIGSAVLISLTLLPATLRVMEMKRKKGRAF